MSFRASEALLARALSVIPGGTGTFSKSRTAYPVGVSPLYLEQGHGCHVWDVDGNQFLDFGSALTAIILGYRDPDVDAAVRAQLEDGVIFGLPHEVEVRVAEFVREMVPCAEMVRFGKNGSDATSGAVRLARAYTGRDHVATCGYHGFADWSIGVSGRNAGVPQAVRDLTHPFVFNDIESLRHIFRDRPGQVACVIMEPMNHTYPEPGFLEAVRDLCHENGALFILDEVITGFRFALGGAQEFFDVTPDLATFGKGLANGYPLSAVAGRADIMRKMVDVHFSFTYSGECLSLAAAEATLLKLRRSHVPGYLAEMGSRLQRGANDLASKHGLDLACTGHPSWTFLRFRDQAQKTLYLQEIFARGILCLGQHAMQWAHAEEDVDRLLAVYDEVFPILKEFEGRETERLRCRPLDGSFRIR
jgi:glutamate-1-semialdehyde 2,1-aminomutase